MKKIVTIASAFVLTAAMTTGLAYAMESADMPEGEGLTIVSSVPAAGTEMAELSAGTIITMVPEGFNEYPDMYVEYELEGTDENGKWEILKSMMWMNRDNGAGNYRAEVYGNYKMYAGTDYRLKFTAWESEDLSHGANRQDEAMGYAYVYLKGTSKPYENSPYTLVDITPAPAPAENPYDNVISNDVTKITLTFDGPVNVDNSQIVLGMGASMKFKAIEPVGETETVDEETYAKEWNLEFPEGYVASQRSSILVSIKAYDKEGRLLLGNTGEKDFSYWLFDFNVEGQYGEVEFDFGAEPITEVTTVTANFANGISVSYNEPIDAVKILKDGAEVASVKSVAQVFAPGDESKLDAVAIGAKMTFDKTVAEPGTYTLFVPNGYFSLGTEFTTWVQRAVSVDFVIGGESVAYTVVPEAGKVEKLQNFEVTFDVEGELTINEDATDKPYILFGEENEKAPFRTFELNGKTLTLGLLNEITEADNYSLVIPAGYLSYGNGKEIPTVVVDYVIEAGDVPVVSNVKVTPAAGKVEALPESIDIVFNDYDEAGGGNGKATIQLNDETPVDLPDADFGEAWNEMIQSLGEFAGKTEEGTYTVTFPAGYFLLGAAGAPSDELTVVYIIGEGGKPVPTMPAEFTPADGSELTALPEKVDFVFPAYDTWGGGSGKATITYNDNEPVNLPDALFDFEAPENEGFQELGEYAGKTDAGTYVITFPAGYFLLGGEGVPAPEMVITYTVAGGQVDPGMLAEFTPANGSVLTELPAQVDFVFPAYDTWGGGFGKATITYNDNEPVNLPDALFDFEAPENEGFQELGEYAGKTDAGTYVITFPAGYFLLGGEGVPSPEMVISYTIEGTVTPATHGVVSVAYGTEMAMSYRLPLGEEAELTMSTPDEFWGIAGFVFNNTEETFEIPVKTYTAKFTVEAQNNFSFIPEYFGICEIMDGTDEVVNLEGGIQVKRIADGVEITGLSVGTPVVVYSVNGQVIRQEVAHNEAVTVTLEKGATYVVRAGEVAVKVLF